MTYRTFSCCRRGYAKLRRDALCQDAVAVKSFPYGQILAVADGHGDRRCLYSHLGASFAVQAACAVLKALAGACPKQGSSHYYNSQREEIALRIFARYARLCLSDFSEKYPEKLSCQAVEELYLFAQDREDTEGQTFTPDQVRERRRLRHDREERLGRILYLYGTTLRATVIGPAYLFHLGLGDGDTVLHFADGTALWALPQSEAYACETSSLCEGKDSVVSTMQFSYQSLAPGKELLTDLSKAPVLITLSTDGLRNSFLSQADFSKKLQQVGHAFSERPREQVLRSVRRLLDRLSRESVFQDDITLAAAYCEETL